MSKIRTGFVSNSSSSSFVVYGVDLDNDEFLSLCVSLYPDKTSNELEEIFDDPWDKFKLDVDEKIGLEVYRDWETDRKSTRLNSSHSGESRMPSSA